MRNVTEAAWRRSFLATANVCRPLAVACNSTAFWDAYTASDGGDGRPCLPDDNFYSRAHSELGTLGGFWAGFLAMAAHLAEEGPSNSTIAFGIPVLMFTAVCGNLRSLRSFQKLRSKDIKVYEHQVNVVKSDLISVFSFTSLLFADYFVSGSSGRCRMSGGLLYWFSFSWTVSTVFVSRFVLMGSCWDRIQAMVYPLNYQIVNQKRRCELIFYPAIAVTYSFVFPVMFPFSHTDSLLKNRSKFCVTADQKSLDILCGFENIPPKEVDLLAVGSLRGTCGAGIPDSVMMVLVFFVVEECVLLGSFVGLVVLYGQSKRRSRALKAKSIRVRDKKTQAWEEESKLSDEAKIALVFIVMYFFGFIQVLSFATSAVCWILEEPVSTCSALDTAAYFATGVQISMSFVYFLVMSRDFRRQFLGLSCLDSLVSTAIIGEKTVFVRQPVLELSKDEDAPKKPTSRF